MKKIVQLLFLSDGEGARGITDRAVRFGGAVVRLGVLNKLETIIKVCM